MNASSVDVFTTYFGTPSLLYTALAVMLFGEYIETSISISKARLSLLLDNSTTIKVRLSET